MPFGFYWLAGMFSIIEHYACADFVKRRGDVFFVLQMMESGMDGKIFEIQPRKPLPTVEYLEPLFAELLNEVWHIYSIGASIKRKRRLWKQTWMPWNLVPTPLYGWRGIWLSPAEDVYKGVKNGGVFAIVFLLQWLLRGKSFDFPVKGPSFLLIFTKNLSTLFSSDMSVKKTIASRGMKGTVWWFGPCFLYDAFAAEADDIHASKSMPTS